MPRHTTQSHMRLRKATMTIVMLQHTAQHMMPQKTTTIITMPQLTIQHRMTLRKTTMAIPTKNQTTRQKALMMVIAMENQIMHKQKVTIIQILNLILKFINLKNSSIKVFLANLSFFNK